MTTTTISVISTTNNTHSRGLTVYTSLATWNDAAPASLVADDVVWVGECYNDGTFSSSSTLLSMSGDTTGASNYKELRCATGQSFSDNANAQSNVLQYNTTNGVAIACSGGYTAAVSAYEAYVRIIGIQITCTVQNGYCLLLGNVNALFDKCILSSDKGGAPTMGLSNVNQTISNSLVMHRSNSAAATLNYGNVYGCTFVRLITGTAPVITIQYGSGALKNCAFFGVTGGNDFRTGSSGVFTNCYTDGGNRPSGVSLLAFDTTTGSGFQSLTTDFRIKSTSGLKDAGATLSSGDTAYYDHDIVSSTRPQNSTFDVGAWEYVVAGGSTITTATLPAGLGAMGSGQTRAIQPAGLSYMG